MNKNIKILYNMFPSVLNKEILDMTSIITFKTNWDYIDGEEISILSEKIIIPRRVYYDFPSEKEIEKLNVLQKEILFCIFTRHHDGYLREKNLKEIIKSKNVWIIPFILELLGEYVIEIISLIAENLEEFDKEQFKMFIDNNKGYFEKKSQNVISYWDCYFKFNFRKKREYIGFHILEYFDEERKIFKMKIR